MINVKNLKIIVLIVTLFTIKCGIKGMFPMPVKKKYAQPALPYGPSKQDTWYKQRLFIERTESRYDELSTMESEREQINRMRTNLIETSVQKDKQNREKSIPFYPFQPSAQLLGMP